jgi:hypothetical protein
MVDDHCALVGWDVDVEFGEHSLDGRRCSVFAREGDEDVSILLHEFQEVVRCEGRAEAFGLARQEEDMVVCSFAVLQ